MVFVNKNEFCMASFSCSVSGKFFYPFCLSCHFLLVFFIPFISSKN